MQNPKQKFRPSSTVFEKPAILSENWKLWRAPATIEFNNFVENLHTFFLLTNDYKRVFRIFLFCLDLELFAKIKKDLVSTHSQKPGLSITQNLKKIKNIPNTLL